MSIHDEAFKKRLRDLSVVGGSETTIGFPLYNTKGEPMGITSTSFKFYLSPYGQPDLTVLELDGIHKTSAEYPYFFIVLPPEKTIGLKGLYSYQIEFEDVYGKTIRPGEGTIEFIGAIKGSTPLGG